MIHIEYLVNEKIYADSKDDKNMGKYHEEKCEIMGRYLGNIANSFAYHIKEDIPGKKIDHAVKRFASGIDRASIIGFFDTTVMGSGKNGYNKAVSGS